jgi:hypothetical protein
MRFILFFKPLIGAGGVAHPSKSSVGLIHVAFTIYILFPIALACRNLADDVVLEANLNSLVRNVKRFRVAHGWHGLSKQVPRYEKTNAPNTATPKNNFCQPDNAINYAHTHTSKEKRWNNNYHTSGSPYNRSMAQRQYILTSVHIHRNNNTRRKHTHVLKNFDSL